METPLWTISLHSPPVIHFSGMGTHGDDEASHRYRMHRLWCIHWYDYQGEIEVGEWRGKIHPGGISLVPPGETLVHHWKHKGSRHYFAHFSLAKGRGEGEPVPAWIDSAPPTLGQAMVTATRYSSRPERAQAALWACLWQVVEIYAGTRRASIPDRAHEFQHYIEQHLADPISLPAIARAFGLSSNHANRLFFKATGSTLCDYWRKRRVEAAWQLLKNTTMGVKQVAHECGYSDLQQFNKLMRRHAGSSPRGLSRMKLG